MKPHILTKEQIDHARTLKEKGYSKREIARLFNVGETTIWENVFATKKRIRIYIKKEREIKQQCALCEIRLKEEVEILDNSYKIPHNFKLGDKCISCVLNERGLEWKAMQNFNILIHTK